MSEILCDRCGGSGVEPTSWPDRSLLVAYQRTDGEAGNSEADALLREIKRRELDI